MTEKIILAALVFSQALTFCLGKKFFFLIFISFYKSNHSGTVAQLLVMILV